MRNFEEYVLEEGIKDWAKSFKTTMQKFHDSKDIDTDLKYLIDRTEKLLAMDGIGKKMPADKKAALNTFVKVLKTANMNTSSGRAKLGKAEKQFAPLLKSFNIGIKI